MFEKIDRYSNYLFKSILLLIIVFISSDIFLVIELSGATIRLSYILFFILFIFLLLYFIFSKRCVLPNDYSYIPLIFFCYISFFSSLSSLFQLKSLIYSFWTVFNLFIIVYLLWFTRNSFNNFLWLIKIYFYSYFVISIIGLYQILLPLLIGNKTPFVMQWWKEYSLARINGFSFEPSYFATYMLMGAFLWFILWLYNSSFVNYKAIIVISVCIVVFLSSSRIGWIGLVLIILYGLMETIKHFSIYKRLSKQYVRFLVALLVIVLFVIISVLTIINNKDTFKFIFQGTGLFDTSDASSTIRFERALKTFQVFIDKPMNIFLGVGPGGVGAYMVNYPEKFQIFASNFERLWATEPSNITLELLASVGIIGFIIFVWFIFSIFKRLWKLQRSDFLDSNYRTICLALFWGLVIELFILQFNQNYLRPYLWLHIGICIVAANNFENLLVKPIGLTD